MRIRPCDAVGLGHGINAAVIGLLLGRELKAHNDITLMFWGICVFGVVVFLCLVAAYGPAPKNKM